MKNSELKIYVTKLEKKGKGKGKVFPSTGLGGP
jgi:hypothetical protein